MATRVPLPSPYEHRTAFWIHGVYSDEECLGLIKMAEDGEGFGRATVTTGADGEQTLMEEYRKSGRRIIVDSALADQIFQRIRPALRQEIKGKPVAGLNPYLRFLRYHPGEYFGLHYDDYRLTSTERSYFTMMLYLNEDFEGGETGFSSFTGDYTKFTPRTGSVLVFEHHLEHEGCMVTKGVKYCVRSDVMYTRKPRKSPT